MDVLWYCLNELTGLLKVIPNFVQVDDHFVRYPMSGMIFKFAHLIIDPRLSRVCFRIVS